ncbi:MAG: substrate-binding domain-containing protein [Paludibacterium sp.]|uniref:substrate-binding domain-containing protein n=1 Tax=Paludibacterium sp. TaxID=1917523 RepID=UPI0025F11ACA|nr:substrate-binding domain-containing protein [Paludibacterium sp.]MBV8049233.1 substrate-binding domain-containing protein [Paludibacterium sp.]MBV8646677.1 substrate-binding domain-containing protein [Paludibacterium sp.]
MRLPLLLFLLVLLSVPAADGACIGVVGAGGGASFWRVIGEGAKAAGRELGVKVVYLTPQTETDREGQLLLIERVMAKRCKALVLAPNAPERGRQVGEWQRQGLPVVFIDRSEPAAAPFSVVATDNYAAGRLAGEQIVRRLAGSGLRRVVLMRLQQGVQSTDERERGVADRLRQAGLAVVASPYLGTTVASARAASEQALRPLDGRFDAVFTPNETTTEGTLLTLQRLGLAGKVMMVGFDVNRRLFTAMRQGSISLLILQRPFQMGYTAVTLAYRMLRGQTDAPRAIDSGVTLLTRENMDQQEILYFSVYRGAAKP